MCDCQMHSDRAVKSLHQKQLFYSEGCIQEKDVQLIELCLLVVKC